MTCLIEFPRSLTKAMTCLIEFPAKWITSNHFESMLSKAGEPLMGPDMDVHVRVPVDCYIMVDAGVRLLSYRY